MNFEASLAATSVGSFPHKDSAAACDLVLDCFPQVPSWPQLPAARLLEQMEIQYSEGLPCIVVDDERERMYFDTSREHTAELERFYENFLAENFDYFAISPKYARGLHRMAEQLSLNGQQQMKYFKCQVTGPVSFGLSIVDENKRAIYYNEMFRDVLVKGMAMKARWQLRKFRSVCERRICTVDEPILSAFGSSTYVSVSRNDVISYLHEMVDAIHAEEALAGVHCCGNTEWTIPIEAGMDLLNFDAYEYGDSILLYPEQIKSFLEAGGILAWGIVPTSEQIEQHTAASLMERFEVLVQRLAAKGIDRELILKQALVTASCGTGTVPMERAERIARTTKQLSDRLKDKYA
jgi:hypothetical protein